MTNTYTTIKTNAGLALETSSQAGGDKITLTHMAIGDGGGSAVTPNADQAALVREQVRLALNAIAPNPDNASQFTAEAIIPASSGGFTLREAGLYTADGVLFAVANLPQVYKPTATEGAFGQVVVTMTFIAANASEVNLTVDENVSVATRLWVQNYVIPAHVFAGGTSGQLLAKSSNEDGSWTWVDPTASVHVLVDTVEEDQILAANQTAITLSKVTANGLGVFVNGIRLRDDEWSKVDDTHITLKQARNDGDRITLLQNEQTGYSDVLRASRNLSDVDDADVALSNLSGLSLKGGRVAGGFAVDSGKIELNGQAATTRMIAMQSNNNNRFAIALSPASENGGNAGSDFTITRYDDNGAELDSPLSVKRSDGSVNVGALTCADVPNLQDSSNNAANTRFVANLFNTGAIPDWSLDFSQLIKGYKKYSLVVYNGLYWRSTADGNLTTPGASGAAWTNFFGGYLATSGAAQSSSAYTAFTNGLSANILSAPNGAADIKISSDIRMGVQTIFANLFATDGTATRKFQGATSVSDGWSFNQAPSIPVGSVSWSGTNTSTLSVGDAYSYFVRGSGASQTVSAATTFSNGLFVPLGISSTATENTAVLATGDAFLSFMRLGGVAQTSSAPTTFRNGLFVPLGISSTATENTAVLATGDAFLSFMRLGGAVQSSSAPTTFSNGLFVNALGAPSGSSDITINAGLRMNSQTAYVNKIATDGSEIRSISGVTNVADLWNFYTRPNFNGSGLALLSEVTPKLTIPGASSPWIQQVSATYNANDGSNGTLINLPSAYPNACLYAFGNDVGNGALAWGIQIVNSGSIRIWGKLGTTYQTGGINLYTIGW